jgi:membrane associated rhomboid family serine protease
LFFVYADSLTKGWRYPCVLSILALQLASLIAFSAGLAPQQLEASLAFSPVRFSIHPVASAYTLVSAAYLHGGFFHWLGNTMFFLSFGRTIERLLGWWRFLIAFSLIGAFSFLGSWLLASNSSALIMGSSGAVAFLMGSYLVLFPHARLRLLILVPPFFKRLWIAAFVFIFLWAGLQALSLVFSGETQDGVAYGTHALGLILGVIAGLAWKEMAFDTDRKLSQITNGLHL